MTASGAASVLSGLEADPSRPQLIQALISGGDERIALDPESGLNGYGCAPAPRPGQRSFASCTASTISAAGHAAAETCLERLLGHGAMQAAYAAEMEGVRRRLAELCGLPPASADHVILAASGTDIHLIVAGLARRSRAGPLTTVMADPAESGRGVPQALCGVRYSALSPHGVRAAPGAALADMPQGRLLTVRVREDDSALRPAEAVDAEFERACALAARTRGPMLLTLLDVSKTGLVAPSRDCAVRLKSRYGDDLTVLVDACQFRLAPESLADCLRQGFLVAVTGSKFLGGPAFSGALFLPPASAGRWAGHAPSLSLGDYSGRQEWPAAFAGRALLPDSPNLGLLLRWQAALEELAAFRRLRPSEVRDVLSRFATAVRGRLEASPAFQPVPAPDPIRSSPGAWDGVATIFPFLPRGPKGLLDEGAVRSLYAGLRSDGDGGSLALGQPVRVGVREGRTLSALRLAIGARDIVEALAGEEGTGGAAERALEALDRTAAAST
jgi:hypothetical protein